jgi:hypothetical protein
VDVKTRPPRAALIIVLVTSRNGEEMPRDILVELVRAGVRPVARSEETGILIEGGRTRPFVVERGWSGPEGHYNEEWSIRKGGREVLYQTEPRLIFIRGVQSVTSYTDTVEERIRLDPGDYQLVFLIEGMYMGHIDIPASALERATA